MSKLQTEKLSTLVVKLVHIEHELSKLNAFLIFYSDTGNKMRVAQVIDAIKRHEMSQEAIKHEIDRRFPNDRDNDKD